MRETIRETRRRLRRRKPNLSNVGLTRETKDPAHLVQRHTLCNFHHVFVYGRAHVVDVGENKRTLGIKTTRDDIFCVFSSQSFAFLKRHVLPQELLIIRQLNHQRYLERLLQPRGEVKRNQMSQVQRLARRPATRVQIKLFTLFVRIENQIHLPVRKEHPTP